MNLTITTYTEDIALGIAENPEVVTLHIKDSLEDAELREKLGNPEKDYNLLYLISKL